MGNKGLPISMPAGVSCVLGRLREAGYGAWLVGGCLRDVYLGQTPQDWDIASAATPREVEWLFAHTAPTGVRYGTVTVLMEGMKVEVTTFRSEGVYGDGRHPDAVHFESSIEADLSRRDFTINAMAWNPDKGWCDPHGGRAGCDGKIIRCVGDPGARFAEDALRMLRAVRFAAQLGFTLDGDTLQAVQKNASSIEKVAMERIREELCKLILAPHAGEGIRLLGETGLGAHILPQAGPNAFTWDPKVWPEDITLRLAGWLGTAYPAGGAREALNRLRFDNTTKGDVLFLLDTWNISPESGPEWVRRRLYAWGRGRMELYLSHQEALRKPVEMVRKALAGVIGRGECVSLKDLALDGADLIDLGIEPGPAVGGALERLMDRVLADPGMNTRENLLNVIEEI
jgi:tRNA nucleotidyltransferase (CCA-adding enzyme)